MGKAVESYNEAVGSLESRVMPTARRFKALGVARREIRNIPVVDKSVRPLGAPDKAE